MPVLPQVLPALRAQRGPRHPSTSRGRERLGKPGMFMPQVQHEEGAQVQRRDWLQAAQATGRAQGPAGHLHYHGEI